MTVATRHQSWGLDSPRDEHWSQRGLCADNPDLWTDPTGRGDIALAKALCRRCDVIDQCRQDALRYRPAGVTIAGVYYDQYGAVTRV